ncbi:MAG: phosphate propanoyltransferase [Clostridia bacterium]
MKVMVETSARHLHVSDADLKILFGEDAVLDNRKELSQPGQYATSFKVEVVGPKGSLMMTILGPTRPVTQVEIAMTDARKIGVSAPIRESGDLEGSAPCTLKGSKGTVELAQGVIVAKRHVHLNEAQAAEAGVVDKQIISVKVDYNGRSLVYGDVVARVNPAYFSAMHVDTDESNAAALPGTVEGEIIV